MNILFLCQNKVEANAWYRSSGIAANLQKKTGHNINVLDLNEIKVDWSVILQHDIIMLQRPFSTESLKIASFIKMCGSKLWIDYDDNLLDVNVDNKVYPFYKRPDIRKNIIEFISMADILTVTTPYLKKAYSEYNKNIHIVPNAVNETIERNLKDRTKTVFWRGTDSHLFNLWSFGSKITNAMKEFKDWNFDFMGYYPWFLESGFGYLESTDLILYFKTIQNIAPSVFHAPLFKDNFNVCRSNISYLEGSFAGAVCIIPDFWEYDYELEGAITYSDFDSYYDAIKSCCTGEVDIVKQNALAWEFIQDNFTLDKINNIRIEIIKNL